MIGKKKVLVLTDFVVLGSREEVDLTVIVFRVFLLGCKVVNKG